MERKRGSGRFVRKRINTLRLVRAFVVDAVCIVVGLLAFFLNSNVFASEIPAESPVVIAPTPTQSPSHTPGVATPTVEATPTPDLGTWGAKYLDKLQHVEPAYSDASYQSENVSIEIQTVAQDGVTYYVADIYIRDIDFLQTAFGSGDFQKFERVSVPDMAEQNDAILAINGDFSQLHSKGLVIRNGVLYRSALTSQDICVLYYDGTMETYSSENVDLDAIVAKGAYQAWSFGPALVEAGVAKYGFTGDVNVKRHPRAGFGYYEPGHYCFIVVDGRQKGYSVGVTCEDFAQIFQDLGCQVAYNLDGGATAVMYFNGQIVNKPTKGGRNSSDFILLKEVKQP